MIFTIILSVICFFWLADTTITFSPFTFKCERPWHAIGMFMLIIGVAITNGSAYNRGYQKGATDGVTEFKDALIEMIESSPEKEKE
jgi:hypothetical protein